jgi:hypothetical protein
MLDTDELDARWRDGLHVLAAHLGATVSPGASDRVTHQVQQRARRRTFGRTAVSAVALAAIIAFVLLLTNGSSHTANVTVAPAAAPGTTKPVPATSTLRISALATLTLVAQVETPSPLVTIAGDAITLEKAGTYRFIMDGAPGHSLGFTELPDGDRIITGADPPHFIDVHLARGTYTFDCNIPGHAAAGMLLHVIVR